MAASKYTSIEVKIGFFVAFCVALFIVMLVTYGKIPRVWRGRQEIAVAFENIGTLTPDAPVRYNGLEVGRVKSVSVLHLDDRSLERFPPFTKSDLDNLPLRPEAITRELRDAPQADFDALCRKALLNRTMIELVLEVLLEDDFKRYRVDDQVHITSTILGDSAVEINSGNGAVNAESGFRLLLGTSGDFFSNLAKSMGDVKDILSNVADVGGAEGRESFSRARGRFRNITQHMSAMGEAAGNRTQATAQKIDNLGTDANKILTNAKKTIEEIPPSARRTADSINQNTQKMRDQAASVQDEVQKAKQELTDETEPLRRDIKEVSQHTKASFAAMSSSMRSAYAKFNGLSDHIDDGEETAASLMSQSFPDWQRFLDAAEVSGVNFAQTKQAGNENKDLVISNHDKGENELNTAVDIYHSLRLAARRMDGAIADLSEAAGDFSTVPAPQDSSPAGPPSADAPPWLASEVRETTQRLATVERPVAEAGNTVEAALLPPFERKKAAWTK